MTSDNLRNLNPVIERNVLVAFRALYSSKRNTLIKQCEECGKMFRYPALYRGVKMCPVCVEEKS